MRRLFVAGNWKMNTTMASAQALASEVAAEVTRSQPNVDVAVCPPFPYLISVGSSLANSPVMLGGQNAHYEKPGAFTGETSLEMLVDVGCRWVVIGHSERRQFFGETDELVNKKIHAAWQRGLDVIFCVGEVLEDRESNRTESVLSTQLQGGLAGVEAGQLGKLVIAYEPVWAIGTGLTPSLNDVAEVHGAMRKDLEARFANEGQAMRLLYGGSVKPDNAKALLSIAHVNGALVGGASLKASDFIAIIRAYET